MFRRGFAVSWMALVAVACGGQIESSATEGPGTSCDRYFTALASLQSCEPFALPASEIARVRPRFDAYCAFVETLPGTAWTDAFLDSCAAAAEAAPCHSALPEACEARGALAGGAACAASEQCASAICSVTEAGSTCGTCAAPIATGSECSPYSNIGCAPGATCDFSVTPQTCTAVTYGGVGAACSDAAYCTAGLACSPTTSTCVPLGPSGAACDATNECVGSLVCIAGVCATPAAAGAPCPHGDQCADGLFCGASSTCVARTWLGSGQPCTLAPGVSCLVGLCSSNSSDTPGTCPVVIPDGDPCTAGDGAHTCDTDARCIDGMCAIPTTSTCD